MFRVLLYYWFAEIADSVKYAAAHRAKCEELDLLGRIIISPEGINGTASGSREACDEYVAWLEAEFPGIEVKSDPADGHAFKALHVRLRAEIISLGVPFSGGPAPHLSASDWKEMMEREDVVLLDGRNAYESEVGRFRGAICPPVQNFREIPGWIEENRELFTGKKVLTYCTGGIRCEKLSAWMLDNGFSNVFQLRGGIVMYGQDEATQGEGFEGVNVVFDERVAVSAGLKSVSLTVCRECGEPSANYVNCANVECNLRMIQCPACEEVKGRSCSKVCRDAPRKRAKGKRWHETTSKQRIARSHGTSIGGLQ